MGLRVSKKMCLRRGGLLMLLVSVVCSHDFLHIFEDILCIDLAKHIPVSCSLHVDWQLYPPIWNSRTWIQECNAVWLDKEVMHYICYLIDRKNWCLMFLIVSSHPSPNFWMKKSSWFAATRHPHLGSQRIEFDCRPGAIAQSLALREPKYQETAAVVLATSRWTCSRFGTITSYYIEHNIDPTLSQNTPTICHRLWLLFTSMCLMNFIQETAAYCHFGREAVTKTLVLKWKNIPGCFQVNLCVVGVL